jgi:hypothetical protein
LSAIDGLVASGDEPNSTPPERLCEIANRAEPG